MEFKEIIFVIIFMSVTLTSSLILYRLADGNYLRLITWSIRLYLFTLFVNLLVSFIKLYNSGDYSNPREYIFIGIDIIILVLLTLFRTILKWKKGEIANGEQQLLTALALLTVVLPILNIGYFINLLKGEY